MVKHGYETIDFENPIKDKMPHIVEYFVKFYGEKHRKTIETKLNSTEFIFLERATEHGLNMLSDRFKKLKAEAKAEEDKKFLDDEEKRIKESFVNNQVRQIEGEFAKKRNELIFDFISSNLGIEDTPYNREVVGRLSENYVDFISIDKKFLTDGLWEDYQLMIAVFADLSGKLKGGMTSELKKNIEKITLPQNTASLKEKIDEMVKERDGKIMASSGVQEAIERVERLNLFDSKEITAFIQEFIVSMSDVGGAQFTTVQKDKPLVSKSICVNNAALDLATSSFVHECTHVISSNCNLNAGQYYTKCGFNSAIAMFLLSGFVDLTGRTNWERYDALNEVATDYLARKVTKLMLDDDFKVGCIDSEPSIYSALFPLFDMFFEEHIEDIKDCFLGDDPLAFANKIGRKNFNELADISTGMLNYCISHRLDGSILNEIKKGSGRSEEDFDIFDVAFDTKIEWNNTEIEEYLMFFREADEIFLNIEDYLEGADEADDFADEDDFEDDDDFDDEDEFDDEENSYME